MAVQNSMDLRRIAHPRLQRLVEETQETARLIVPHPLGPVCIDVVESPRGIRVFAQLGAKMPWNAGMSPKLILAHVPEDERERIITRHPFKRYTRRTIVDVAALRRESEEQGRRHCGQAAADDRKPRPLERPSHCRIAEAPHDHRVVTRAPAARPWR